MFSFKISSNNFLVFIILILLPFVNYSQTFTKNIEWQNKRYISDSLTGFYVLDFENADFFNDNLVPHHSGKIQFTEEYNENYTYSLVPVNLSFEKMSNEEIAGVMGLYEISNDIEFQADLYFDRGKAIFHYRILPVKKNSSNNSYEKLISFDLQVEKKLRKSKKSKTEYVSNSVLSTGTWVKIRLSETGIYKLSFSELESMGISNPQNVRIFGNDAGWLPMIAGEERPQDLVENDILINNNEVIFFAYGPNKKKYSESRSIYEPYHHYYSKYAYYYLSSDYNSAYDNSIKTINSTPNEPTHIVDTYNAFEVHNNDLINVAETGRVWYGEAFDIEPNQEFTFNFPNLVNSSNSKISVYTASTSPSSTFTVSANGESSSMSFGSVSTYKFVDRSSTTFNIPNGSSDDITVQMDFISSSPAAQAWLDQIYINAECELRFTSGQMMFSNFETLGENNITEYLLSNAGNDVIIWDVSDPTKPKRVNSNITGSVQDFRFESDELKEFIAFDNTQFLKPDIQNYEQIANQNLHAVSGNTDMIIVTHPDFLSQANELKTIHEEQDDMRVVVSTIQEVYNEFSCGAPDFSAIRDFAKMVYDKTDGVDTLKYLLLFGDGSYDNRSGIGVNGNYMVTYQQFYSDGLGSSFVTDDFFALLDANEGDNGNSLSGWLDIGVGRIPVSTSQEASNYIEKVKHYLDPSTFGDWRNQLCFIADDEDSRVHMRDADSLTRIVETLQPVFNIQKIYLDAYTQFTESGGERYPDVNNAINNAVQKGSLLINYTGHGGEHGLAHERVVTVSEIESWTNFDKLALFVTATCEFTRFDDYGFTSAGERVILNPNGGAIAMFTTARVAYIWQNFKLSEQFYQYVFEKDHKGKQLRLGDIIRKTKNGVSQTNKLIFFLMGDPALKLGYASDNEVVTTFINSKPVSEVDTLKALSEVIFEGEIRDKNGQKLTNFNGQVFSTVYDKMRTINTVDNDGIGEFTYKTRDNIVYRGTSTVSKGDFSFRFIVPKDIALNVDTGKTSYYAHNNLLDAKGYSFDFLIGDIATDYEEDIEGPQIDLYMNDENFVSGGMTDVNPRIYARLYDEHGINTASGGIGHDITGVLNDDVQNIIIMNDDYRADENTYKSGTVEHFLFKLEPGDHTLKFKAWDVYNNSSEANIDFVVVESENLTIDRLLNYPNPFTTHTDFYFEHNQAGTEMDVLIQVFTVSGKLVKSIESSFFADGYRAGPYAWDGTDDFGNRIGRGVYVYRVKLRSSTGEVVEKFEKLLILK
jgi:hypothetical protein